MNHDPTRVLPIPDDQETASRYWLGIERKWWVLITVGIGGLAGALDLTVVNTVLPVIRESFGAQMSSIEWVVMSYLLTISIFLLTFGRMGDIFGHKHVYYVGLVVFTAGSVLCGISRSEIFLIGFRAFQGIGAAMISANAMAILTWTFPQKQRGQAVGLLVMMTYVGIAFGPALGGYLTDQLGWRSIFFVNLPIGTLAAIMAFFVIPRHALSEKRESFDVLGASALVVGLGSLMFALSKGQDLAWTSAPIIGLFVVAMASIAIFLKIESAVRFPMLDLGLFSSRLFTSATVSACLNYLCVFSSLFLLPFYLVQGRGFTPGSAGILITAQPATMMVIAPLSGYFSDRIGSRLLSTTGMVFVAAGMFAYSKLGAQSSEPSMLLSLVLTGIGNGLFVSPNSSAIMGSAPRHRQGIAAGMVATARNLGMVLGVAISGAILSTQLALQTAATGDPREAFFGAVRFTFMSIGFIAIAAAVTSSIRGAPPVAAQTEAASAQ
ncbi:MAG: MFS transporter [Dehalococcoidia bacterium]|nr:MFS transporter [Dehalococcoidia bacterium]